MSEANRRTSKALQLSSIAVLLGLLCGTGSVEEASAADEPQTDLVPLHTLLNPDGTLDLSSGFSGALDPAGYRMEYAADAAPRFTPEAAGVPRSPANSWNALGAGLGSVRASQAAPGALTFVEAVFDEPAVDGASSVAVSPDGDYVYVACQGDDAVVVFSRDGATGALAFVERERDGVGGVDGLDDAISVAVSPEGGHVYVAGRDDDAVAVFSRDGATGELTFVEMEQDGVGGVDGLDGTYAVALSPDGDNVYVAARHEHAVAVFGRDGATGALTFVEMEQDGVGGVDGLHGAHAVAVSPDGHHVYVASATDDAVAVFSRDGATGALTFVDMEQDGIDGVDGLNGARSVSVSPGGQHVYVASGSDDAVAVFSRDGATGALTFVEMEQDGAGTVDGLDGARSVAVSPDGQHVYVSGEYDDAAAVFSRDPVSGALSYVEVHKDGVSGLDGLGAAYAVAVSPDGGHVYLAGWSDDAVAVFSRDGATGSLAFVEMEQDGAGGVDGLDSASWVAVSPDGQHVYVAGFYDEAVAVFSREWATGTLTFIEMQENGVGGVDGLYGARCVALSPDGEHLYVAGAYDDAVVVFSRDKTTGALAFLEMEQNGVGGVQGLSRPYSVALSPDGDNVYVAGYSSSGVAVFGRDAVSGALNYLEFHKDGVDGVEGLDGAVSVAVSPDGDHVYVAGGTDDAVAVFSRDVATGTLTFVDMEQDGIDGVDGLDGAHSVAISPDGGHVYVAGQYDDAVAVFSRDAVSGELAFVEMEQDGGGVDGLNGARSLAVSPDGQHVYVAGHYDDAVAVFSRDPVSGALSYIEVHKDGVMGVDGLEGAYGVAVSPDRDHVYVAGWDDDAVAVFARQPCRVYLPLVLR
jgi:6-phosphogluconolactonase (cycloisomerase 2 family)